MFLVKRRRFLTREEEAEILMKKASGKFTDKELAQQYIQDRSKTLTEISFMLGFSEVSSFSRAFKGWTGKPPSEARQNVA